MRLTGLERNRENAIILGQKLKSAINEEVGDYLKCSIGISSSPWLAKLAGEFEKPDGLTVLPLEKLADFYKQLKLTDLPGINLRMQAQLNRHNIRTTADFFNSPLSDLSTWFGHPGRVWYHRLRGYEIGETAAAAKSVGHSHVLAPSFRSFDGGRRVLSKMAEKCAKRLRQKKLWTNSIAVSISSFDYGYKSQHLKTDLICDSQSIRQAALGLYEGFQIKKPLKVSVTLFDLRQISNRPISLFSDIEKSKRVSEALDQINDRFGDDTIYSASQFDTEDAAPNHIHFGDPDRLGF